MDAVTQQKGARATGAARQRVDQLPASRRVDLDRQFASATAGLRIRGQPLSMGSPARARTDKALAAFDAAMPKLAQFRHGTEHFDEWSLGKGEISHLKRPASPFPNEGDARDCARWRWLVLAHRSGRSPLLWTGKESVPQACASAILRSVGKESYAAISGVGASVWCQPCKYASCGSGHWR